MISSLMLGNMTDSFTCTVISYCISHLAYRNSCSCDVTCNISDDLKKYFGLYQIPDYENKDTDGKIQLIPQFLEVAKCSMHRYTEEVNKFGYHAILCQGHTFFLLYDMT